MNQRKFDDFDSYASDYRRLHTENVEKISGVDSDYFSAYKIVELRLHEKDEKAPVILDYGCGDGNSAAHILRELKPIAYHGLDVSEESIAQARLRNLAGCHFQNFDGGAFPYESGTFDIVFIANVLHHIDPSVHAHILAECHRVLVHGGRLYIFEHNPINPVTRKIVRDCVFDEDAVLVGSRYLRRVVMQAGFSVIKKRYTIFFPRKSFFKKLVSIEKCLYGCPLGGQYYLRCVKDLRVSDEEWARG